MKKQDVYTAILKPGMRTGDHIYSYTKKDAKNGIFSATIAILFVISLLGLSFYCGIMVMEGVCQ